MVNIICAADAVQQIHEVVDRCNDIRWCNMFNRLINQAVRNNFNNFTVFNWREYIDRLKWNIFRLQHSSSHLIRLKANIAFKTRKNLIKQAAVNHLTSFRNNLTCVRINERLSQTLIKQTVLNVELLVDLVTTNIR